jgi:zinc protease
MVDLEFAVGGDAVALEREVRTILARIVKEGVPPELVAAAKLQERSEVEFARNSIEGLATEWAEAVAVDGADSPQQELEQLERVSVDDVNRVARKYLDPDHAIVAVLTPHPSGQPKAATGFGGQESISLGEPKATPLPAWARNALAQLEVPRSHVQPVVTRLANGLTLIVQAEDVSDSVSVIGHIRNRPELEVPQGQEGLSLVLDPLFSYGSERLDRLAFQRALDEIGANESAGTDFSVQVLSEHFERAVSLLAENELHPAFPQRAFDVVRSQVRAAVAGRLTSPGYLAHRATQRALVPPGDPTLREALPKTLDTLTLADLRKYYQDAFRPDLTAIVVIGRVTPGQARAAIEKRFGDWHAAGAAPPTVLPPVPPSRASASAVPDASRVQDEVTLAETIPLTRTDPDVYALRLGNAVLGGGFYSTRLSRDLRKDAGLVYSIDSGFELGQTRGVFLTAYACDPVNVGKVAASVARELQTMRKAPPTDDELQRAKAMLLRHTQLAESGTNGIAVGLLDRWRLGLPFDEPTIAAKHYLALTGDAVQAAFAKYVRPDDLARVSVGPAQR